MTVKTVGCSFCKMPVLKALNDLKLFVQLENGLEAN